MTSRPLQLVWFRQDLRLEDNTALYHASRAGDVIGLFIDCHEQYKKHNESESKISLRRNIVRELRKELNELDIPLVYQGAKSFDECESIIGSLMAEHSITTCWFNNEYLLNEVKRDRKVEKKLKDRGCEAKRFDSDLILAPNKLKTLQGRPYKVFTPYKKAWLNHYQVSVPEIFPKPSKQNRGRLELQKGEIPEGISYRVNLWHSSYKEQINKIQKFLEKQKKYKQTRDYPSINGTSLISPYLALGSVSAKTMANEIVVQSIADGEVTWQDNVWLSELIWRDFYRQIMIDNMSALCKHKSFKPSIEPWFENEEGVRRFEAWKIGETGFPIIDAAMKQLNQTGWMHNRLRMVTSMFLTKLCLVNWRWGEKYFMQQLIDGDFASNNGGWQWCASTGADAVPYFRIMNPISQSKKFDADGAFIKKFLPELAELNQKDIHFPTSEQRKEAAYPEPIIDYKEARRLALELLSR